MSKHSKNLFITVALCMAFVFSAGASGKVANYLGNAYFLSSVIEKTVAAYSREIESYVKENAVLNALSEIASGSYSQEFVTDEFSFTLTEDKDTGCFAINLSIEGFPETIDFYLNDTSLILGTGEIINIEVDPKSIGSDLYSFLDKNKEMFGLEGMEDFEIIRDILDTVDLSYSGLYTNTYAQDTYDNEAISEAIGSTFKALIDRADFSMDKSEIDIGDETVDCDLFTLSFEGAHFVDWFKSDFRALFAENEDIRALYEDAAAYSDMITSASSDYNEFDYDYDSFINELDLMIEVLESDPEDVEDAYMYVELYIYKDVIVGAYLELGEDDTYISMTLAAVGAERRLDSVFLIAEEDEEVVFYIAADTLATAPGVIESYIESADYRDYSNPTEILELKWDSNLSVNNFSITHTHIDDYDEYSKDMTFTFAADKDAVIFAQTQEEPNVAWVLEPLKSSVTIPENTIKLKDMNIMEVISELEEIFNSLAQ